MKVRRSSILLLIVFVFCSVSSHAAALNEWKPAKTWVFFVSIIEWKDVDAFDPLPVENRKDVVFLNTLRQRGIPEDHITYFKDRSATTNAVQRGFTQFLQKPAADDWILVYFSGHGWKTGRGISYLATYDVDDRIMGWRFDAVPAAIDRYFKGSKAVIALDACYSGAMAHDIKRTKRRVSYAVLASSLASQESPVDWTFTEALISAFSGAQFVDKDHDGHITFAEMGQNAVDDMLFGEEQMATIAFTGEFDPQEVIAETLPSASTRLGERVEAKVRDGWNRAYIADVKDDRYRVHYYGTDDARDEWVGESSIRAPRSLRYVIGEKVDVEWKKQWYPATILRVKGRSHLVKYAGYGSTWNAWVSASRIRRRA
jgi:hypothetical protein